MKHFFDVGANIGQTFCDYINKHSELDGCAVWCFEPSPRHWQQLSAVAKEQAARYQVHVCPFGLGGPNGIGVFYTKDDPRGDSFEEYLASDHVTTNQSDGYFTHAVTAGIAEFILQNTCYEDEIVLKLDCEGSEYEILAWLLLSPEALCRVKEIFVEWHNIGRTPLLGSQHLSNLYSDAGKPLRNWMF